MEGKLNLNLDKFETKPSSFGVYVKFAEKDGASAWINVVVGLTNIKNPKNDAGMIPVMAAAIRIRIYGGNASSNPMPGFENAVWQDYGKDNPYWKVRMLVPIETAEKGTVAFVKRFKEVVTPDIIEALKAALKKNRAKLILKADSLTTVIEEKVDAIPLAGRLTVYKGVSFKPETTKAEE